ncbi:DUF2848 domain-containing protein [Amycolatopsis acidiphila]|uniref:DUF2848 domain-containing protein n=1 Tax=Amycolatopsis acidiphila TaxID=715473 RepID=A0A558AP01_9PSEU|nr:DUF2848 family protein [Amycolatopsis acidiphila]TVT25994.1 DUF2848 domain-containing protein [Amycolatopsis acidiphila]UIJ63291.1 DUF2848 domain-containing protein [Amycolatopsis acidiphila]GHG74829.1 hypothetical protein GCM10017788_39120 [Amycolatopsis acidiphila]
MPANRALPVHVAGTGERLTIEPERLVVAGYTAKDEAAVRAHIAELADIGVPPPSSVPAFYDLDPALLTADAVVEVGGRKTSGEVEPVVIRHGGRYFLGVGSDHTDRELEREDVAGSKAACPKPLGSVVADAGTDLSEVDWDRLLAGSTVDGRPYQEGSVSTLRHPAELVERMNAVLDVPCTVDLVLYCGTLPLPGGEFVYGSAWRVQLELPGGHTLAHAYETRTRRL